jgi:2-methylcitrate dehydratase PrpD
MGWKYVPDGVTSAQQNLSYCVATFLIESEVFVDQFTDDRLTDPVRIALAEKLEMRHDPAITAKGGQYREMVRVELRLRDGTTMEQIMETSRDKSMRPGTARVVAKFEKLAAHVLSKAQAAQLRDAVLNLENLPDARVLARLLKKP